MTETITKMVSCCIASPSLSAMLLPGTIKDGLNCLKFRIWILEFLKIFIKQLFFVSNRGGFIVTNLDHESPV